MSSGRFFYSVFEVITTSRHFLQQFKNLSLKPSSNESTHHNIVSVVYSLSDNGYI